MYFVILNSAGYPVVEALSREELLKRINENYYRDREFVSELPDRNVDEWEDEVLIIKGCPVTPRAVEVVKEYDIE